MKKILALFASVSLTALASSSVIACGIMVKYPRVDLSNTKINLNLTTRFNYQTYSYEEIEQLVGQELLKELPISHNKRKTTLKPTLGRDYTIDKTVFNVDGKLPLPTRITVSATNNSRFFTGSYVISAFINLQPLIDYYVESGTYDVGNRQLTNLKDLLAQYKISASDYVLTEDENGSWEIRSNPTGLLELNFKYTSQKEDISAMVLKPIMVNTSQPLVESEIGIQMQDQFNNAILGVDFRIIGTTYNNGGGFLEVSALPTSKRLTGSFKIDVKKVDLTNTVLLTPLTVGATVSEIVQTIINQVHQINPELIIALGTDFTIQISEENNKKVVKVITNEDSKLITGSFEFSLEKISLTNAIKVDSMVVGDNFTNKMNNIVSQLEKLVPNYPLKVDEDYEIIDSSNQGKVKGTVEIKAKDTSSLIEGSISFAVNTVDISKASIIEINRPIQWQELKARIIDELEKKYFSDKEGIRLSALDFYNAELNQLKDTDLVTTSGDYLFTTNNSKIIHGDFMVKVSIPKVAEIKIANKHYRLNEVKMIENEILTELQNLYNPAGITVNRDDFVIYDDQNQVVNFTTSTNWNAGIYHVEAPKTGRILFADSFSIVVDKLVISNELVTLNNLVVGGNYQGEINKFITALNQVVPGLTFVEGVDYQIVDSTNKGMIAGTVTIQTVNSKKLDGSISFVVNTVDISKASIIEINRPIQWGQLKAIIIDEIQNKFFSDKEGIKVNASDFNNTELDQLKDTDLVSPADYLFTTNNSKIVHGNFMVKVLTPRAAEIKIANKHYQLNEVKMIENEILTELQNLYTPVGIEVNRDDFVIYDDQNQVVNFATSTNWNAGIYRVEAPKTGRKLFAGSFNVVVDKLVISNDFVTLNNLVVGGNYQGEINKFIAALNQVVPGLTFVEGVDYQIADSTNKGMIAGTVRIQTVNSKKLDGSISFAVNTVDVSNTSLIEINRPIEWGQLKAQIIDELQNKYFSDKEGIKVNASDFNNTELNQLNDTDLVTTRGDYLFTTNNSKIMHGNFIVKVSIPRVDEIKIVNKHYQLNEVKTIENEILTELQNLYTPIGIEVNRDDFVIYDDQNQVVNFATSTNWNAGTYRVEAPKTGRILFGDSFNIVVDKLVISNDFVTLNDILVDEDYQAEIDKFIAALEQAVPGLPFVEGVDYQIVDPTNKGKTPGTVTIQTVNSKKLDGSISFTVKPLPRPSVEGIRITRSFRDLTWEGVRFYIIRDINSRLGTDITNADFVIINPRTGQEIIGNRDTINGNAAPGQYILRATARSTKIEGEFLFTV